MKVREGPLAGLRVIDGVVHADRRGAFREAWQAARYEAAGLPAHFAQDNVVLSHAGVLRGLHFQHPNGQGKLVSALAGEVFDVAVDVRVGSPTFGRWAGYTLSDANARQLYLPPGMAHGVLALSAHSVLTYKCTVPWSMADERVLRWDDPALGIAWPIAHAPLLSPRDAAGVCLVDLPPERLPRYAPPAGAQPAGAPGVVAGSVDGLSGRDRAPSAVAGGER